MFGLESMKSKQIDLKKIGILDLVELMILIVATNISHLLFWLDSN